MKKVVLAVILSIVVLLGSVPTSFANPASTATYTVKANKTAVKAGDEIEFSVEIAQTGNLAAVEAYVQLPTELTLVTGSFLPATSKAELGWDDFTVDENYLMIYGYGSVGYEGTPLTLATFKCIVNANVTDSFSVTLYDVFALDAMTNDKYPVVVPATIDILVPVTGVTLDRETLELDTGSNKTATLIASVDPDIATNKTLIWESTDETVAVVNEGVVTAIKHGTATITVKTEEGGFSDTCTVTVSCAHTDKALQSKKEANCQEGGWDAYYVCSDCGVMFAEDGTTQISAIPTTDVNVNNHVNEQDFPADIATCTKEGNDAYTKCMSCGVVTVGSDLKYYGAHEYGTLITATTEIHNQTELKPAVAAHYHCDVCDKYFTEQKEETTLGALTGETPSHSYGNWINTDAEQHWKECGCGAKSQIGEHQYDHNCDTDCNICGYTRVINHIPSVTWETDGNYHWKECSVVGCGVVIEGSKVIHSTNKTENTATCQKVAVCDTCGVSFGSLGEHKYTAQTVKAEALVTEGNCRDEAVYYYSCAVCDNVEGDSNHTFNGTKVATNHVGGTIIINSSVANHKTQTDGYTGDTKCLGCNDIIGYGQAIPVEPHVGANNWSTDETYHWKECVVTGCGAVIDGTKMTHYSNKAENKATCYKLAICDECGVSYGTVIPHEWETDYTKDATGHWFACKNTECNGKNGFEAHTPDHTGSATDEYAIKCTKCFYEIEAKLPHTHVYDKEVAKDIYKASNATCDKQATYYKSCKCGAFKDGEVFYYGPLEDHSWDDATCTAPKTCSVCDTTEGNALGHLESTEWVKDSTGHWKVCTRANCGVAIESTKTTHTPDRPEPTDTEDVKCTVCGFIIATHNKPHYHVHSKEWKHNFYEHWNECSCSNRAFIAYHADDNFDGKCDTCGYEMPLVAGAPIPTSPKTGYNSMTWIWPALAGVFGALCVLANALRKRR